MVRRRRIGFNRAPVRKIVVHRPGGWDRLVVETHAEPAPRAGEVRVAVVAAGVNYADCVVRMGLYASAKKYVGWPITPGFEFAGRVSAAGEGVSDIAVGDEVFGVTRFGGYSTDIVVPRHQLFPLPRGWDLAEAAAFPTVAMTACYALFELAHPRPGARILVHSAAGGVGGMLLQLSRIAGCAPIAVVGGAHKVKAAESLGAAAVIDKRAYDLWTEARRHAPGGYDVILDANGVSTLRASYAHLRPTGKLVVYGFHSMLPRRGGRPDWLKLAWDYLRTPRFNPLSLTNENKSILAFNLSYLFEERALLTESMTRLLAWVGEGRIQKPSITRYPLEDAARAHRDIESGETTGKLVLTM